MTKYLLLLVAFCSLYAQANYTLYAPPITATVTTVSTQIIAAKSNRSYLLLQNKGSVDVILKVGSVQSASEGITLIAGGVYEPNVAPGNAVFAKTGSSTAAVTIVEGVQ